MSWNDEARRGASSLGVIVIPNVISYHGINRQRSRVRIAQLNGREEKQARHRFNVLLVIIPKWSRNKTTQQICKAYRGNDVDRFTEGYGYRCRACRQ